MEPRSPFNQFKRIFTVAGCSVLAITAWVATAGAQNPGFEAPMQTVPGPVQTFPATEGPIPAPEDLRAPDGFVQAQNQPVTITLVNNTGADIVYRVVGHTQERYLGGNESVDLADIPVPATVTFYTTDGRLLTAGVSTAAEADGQVQLTIEGTTLLAENQNSMIIQDSGYIFLQ